MQKRDPGLHTGHRERMKSQFRENGLLQFNDHQKLELLLFYCTPRQDTNELAHRILSGCGGTFCSVLDHPYHSLLEFNGIGEHAATFLSMIPQVASYYLSSKQLVDKNLDLKALEVVCSYFEGIFVGIHDEEVHAAAITKEFRLIREKKICNGSIGSAAVDPRSVMEFALESHADHIILSHNHPGSSAIPSRQDIEITAELIKYFRPFRIAIEDHIIVGNSGSMSMRSSYLTSGNIWSLRDDDPGIVV